jgi:hypothetical protein
MALDEALLDTGKADFTLRFFRWAPGARPSVTFGYFQRYREVQTAVSPLPALRATSPEGGGNQKETAPAERFSTLGTARGAVPSPFGGGRPEGAGGGDAYLSGSAVNFLRQESLQK